jgi:hypothetical protein
MALMNFPRGFKLYEANCRTPAAMKSKALFDFLTDKKYCLGALEVLVFAFWHSLVSLRVLSREIWEKIRAGDTNDNENNN